MLDPERQREAITRLKKKKPRRHEPTGQSTLKETSRRHQAARLPITARGATPVSQRLADQRSIMSLVPAVSGTGQRLRLLSLPRLRLTTIEKRLISEAGTLAFGIAANQTSRTDLRPSPIEDSIGPPEIVGIVKR